MAIMKSAGARTVLLFLVLAIGSGHGLEGSETETASYRNAAGQAMAMTVMRPRESPVGRMHPTIIAFHGGGWTGGDPGQFHDVALRLAEHGWLVVLPRYRLAATDGQGSTVADAVDDAFAVLAWVQAEAERLGADRSCIVAMGGSAGGHLAACLALVPRKEQVVRPRALVLYNPVLDVGPHGYGHALASRGVADATVISPMQRLTADLPPTLIIHGTADRVVPLAQVRSFRERALALGSACSLVERAGAGHGFFNGSPDSVLPDTIAFLDHLRAKP